MQNLLWPHQTPHFRLWLLRHHRIRSWGLHFGLDNEKDRSIRKSGNTGVRNLPSEVLREDESGEKENMLQNITIKNKKLRKTWNNDFYCHVYLVCDFAGGGSPLRHSAFSGKRANIDFLWLRFRDIFQNYRAVLHFEGGEGSFQEEKEISRRLYHSNCLSHFDAKNSSQKMISIPSSYSII